MNFSIMVESPEDRHRQFQFLLAHYGFQGLDRNPLNLEDYGYKSH